MYQPVENKITGSTVFSTRSLRITAEWIQHFLFLPCSLNMTPTISVESGVKKSPVHCLAFLDERILF